MLLNPVWLNAYIIWGLYVESEKVLTEYVQKDKTADGKNR